MRRFLGPFQLRCEWFRLQLLDFGQACARSTGSAASVERRRREPDSPLSAYAHLIHTHSDFGIYEVPGLQNGYRMKHKPLNCKHCLRLSSLLCRTIRGGRIISCKSAKDRTGMAITLEETRWVYVGIITLCFFASIVLSDTF